MSLVELKKKFLVEYSIQRPFARQNILSQHPLEPEPEPTLEPEPRESE